MTVFFLLLLILSGVLLPNYTCASRVRRQNAKVRISAIGNTIMLKFLQEDMDTKLEGYILGYGSSMFSRQFLQLPENGEPYETEIDAEPKYLIAVQPMKEKKIKKQCADKETLQNPLHLVIGSVSPTSVVLSWSAILNNPYTDTNVDECIEDGQYTVRYKEKEPNTNWLYQTCPTTTTVIDQLKPDTPYEFGVRAETETVSRDWSTPVTHNTADIDEPLLPYLEPITEGPQAPVPSLPNVHEPLLPYLEPITERPQVPVPSLPNVQEPLLPYLEPVTEEPQAPIPSLPIVNSVTQSRPSALLRHTAPSPIPRMSPGTGSDAIATSPRSEDPLFLTQTSSFTHTPVNLPPPKTTNVSQPKSHTKAALSITNQQQLHTPHFQLTTSTDKITLSEVTDQLNVTSQLSSTSNLQTVSNKTKSQPRKSKSQPKTPKPQTRAPRPNTARFQDKKAIHQSRKTQSKHTTPHPHTTKSQSTTTQTEVHTTQSSPHITHSQPTTTHSQSHTTQSPQHITHTQTTTTQSQAYTTKSPPHITQPQPHTTQSTTHITQSQITTTQLQTTTTQSQAHTTKSPPHITQRQPHTAQSTKHITQSQITTTQSQAHTTQSPQRITQPQPTATKSEAHTTQSPPHIIQSQPTTTHSQPHTTQSQPHTTQSQPKYQPKKPRPRAPKTKQHKTQLQHTKTIKQPNIKPRTPQPHKPQSRPITSQTLPNATISQPSTIKYQSRTVQPRPETTQFTTTQSQASTAQKSSTVQPLTSTIYQHVPTQHKPINKQTNFTQYQSLPIKDQPSKKQQPTLFYQEPVIQHNQALTSPNTLQITSVQEASITRIPEADIQEDRASLRTTDQHPTAAKVTISPIRSQDVYALSTTEIGTKTRRVEPVSSTKSQYQPAPTQHHHPTQATFRNPHTTPWKSDKPEFTTISEPQTTNGSYNATKHNVHKQPFEKVKPSSKYNDNKNVPLTEKKVVREKLPGRKPAPSQSQDGQHPKPAVVNGVKKGNKGRANSSSSVVRPSATTVIQTPRDEKLKGLLQSMPSKEPSQKLELQGNIRPPLIWKKSKKVEKQPGKEEGKKQRDPSDNEILKPQAAPTTKKPVYEQPEPTTTPFFAFNGSRFDTGDNSSVFSSVPVSSVDAQGKKRYTAPHVIYKTDKPPDEPCSVTKSLSYFPDEESFPINVTGPPKTPPTNLTVVTVEGCPSFVILDWEIADNETTEYQVTSAKKGANGDEVSVITTNQTHTAVENLKPESSYEFRVTPKNELGSGPVSEPVSFSTESADPRVSEIPTGKNAIWSSFPFKADSYSECTGTMYVKRTWYRKFVGIQLCNSLRYKIFLSDSLKGKFYNIGDEAGYGEDHCQFVDSFLDGQTGGPLLPHQLPPKQGFYRGVRQEPVKFGVIGGNTQINYVAWYECGVPIPGSW